MWVIFSLLDPLTRLNPDPIRIRIQHFRLNTNPDPDPQPWRRQVAAAVARRKENRRRRLEKARRTGALFECGCCFDAECPLYEVRKTKTIFRIPWQGSDTVIFRYCFLDFDRKTRGTRHRLNMALDLQSLFGLHVYSCPDWLKPRNSPPPPRSTR